MSHTVHCPSCGGPVEVRSRAIQLAVCPFCDQSIVLTPEGAQAGGKVAALADMFTELSTGAAGMLQGRTFQVAGRVRYAWSDGYWDEWAVWFDDGTEGWLHEDEGELSLLRQVPLEGPVSLQTARVGKTLRVNGTDVYVTEMRSATVKGAEGQVPRGVAPGQQLQYVDGKVSGQHWMLELVDGELELFVGDRLPDDALEVHGA
ncbi:MAG: DUF4178 domain-containing protein [Myxococcales bacterium]|nr:DUF4178 domain-containing protein [Myxococcales bacterium]MCB9673153.1 DUF4178 domain-containing protein [Alphaproteobacteria bacterium]